MIIYTPRKKHKVKNVSGLPLHGDKRGSVLFILNYFKSLFSTRPSE